MVIFSLGDGDGRPREVKQISKFKKVLVNLRIGHSIKLRMIQHSPFLVGSVIPSEELPTKEEKLPTKEQYRQWLEERFEPLPSTPEGGVFEDFYSALWDALAWSINIDRSEDSWIGIRNTMKGATGTVHRWNLYSYQVRISSV